MDELVDSGRLTFSDDLIIDMATKHGRHVTIGHPYIYYDDSDPNQINIVEDTTRLRVYTETSYPRITFETMSRCDAQGDRSSHTVIQFHPAPDGGPRKPPHRVSVKFGGKDDDTLTVTEAPGLRTPATTRAVIDSMGWDDAMPYMQLELSSQMLELPASAGHEVHIFPENFPMSPPIILHSAFLERHGLRPPGEAAAATWFTWVSEMVWGSAKRPVVPPAAVSTEVAEWISSIPYDATSARLPRGWTAAQVVEAANVLREMGILTQ